MWAMDPVQSSFVVDASPELAFEVFTLGMGSWWDPAYTPDASSFDGIAIGQELGAHVSMVHGDSTYTWGHVTAWEPGAHYGQTFWLAMDPAYPSTIDVRFTTEGPGTRVDFEHGGWNDDNAAFREKYGDWGHLLGRYRNAVSQVG